MKKLIVLLLFPLIAFAEPDTAPICQEQNGISLCEKYQSLIIANDNCNQNYLIKSVCCFNSQQDIIKANKKIKKLKKKIEHLKNLLN